MPKTSEFHNQRRKIWKTEKEKKKNPKSQGVRRLSLSLSLRGTSSRPTHLQAPPHPLPHPALPASLAKALGQLAMIPFGPGLGSVGRTHKRLNAVGRSGLAAGIGVP